MARIKHSVAAMASDIDRTSKHVDVLISETRELVAAVRELVKVISDRGLTVGAEVAGIEIPAEIVIEPNNEGEN